MTSEAPYWFDRAACKGLMAGAVDESICWEECPVREQCLAYAMGVADWIGTAYMPHLVWGGYSAYARELSMKEAGYNVTQAVNLLEGK